jgi:DNA-binding protein HU-beta
VNKAELVAALEGRLGSRKAAAEAIEAIIDTVTRAVARGEKVAISGFGSFEKAVRGPRVGRNPRTGDTVKIKKTSVPRFKPGTAFKMYVANPKSLPKVAAVSATTAARSAARAATVAAASGAAKAPAKRATTTKAAAKTPARRPAKKA